MSRGGRPVFTVAERDRVRDRVLEMARADRRVTAGAMVGSLAGGGDRWSDLDLTFGLAAGVNTSEILADWSASLEREFAALQLFDLPYQTSIYRVYLLPGNLQVDLSFTPAHEFGAIGPRFKLLFGQAVERPHPPMPSAESLLGYAAHHAVRARFCIARDKHWQAEYWISGVRDQALSLACLPRDLDPRQGRGYDELPEDVRTAFEDALVRSLDRSELLRALGSAIGLLLRESQAASAMAAPLEPRLRALVSGDWPDG